MSRPFPHDAVLHRHLNLLHALQPVPDEFLQLAQAFDRRVRAEGNASAISSPQRTES